MTDRKEVIALIAKVTARGYVARACYNRQGQLDFVRLHGFKKMDPLSFAEWARAL